MCIAIVCKPGCNVMNVEVKLKYLEKEKSFKAFSIIFTGLSIKEITQIFLEGESPTLKNICEGKFVN